MSKNKNRNRDPEKAEAPARKPELPKTDKYKHCGMPTETAAGEKTVFCNGCHAWLSTDKLIRLVGENDDEIASLADEQAELAKIEKENEAREASNAG